MSKSLETVFFPQISMKKVRCILYHKYALRDIRIDSFPPNHWYLTPFPLTDTKELSWLCMVEGNKEILLLNAMPFLILKPTNHIFGIPHSFTTSIRSITFPAIHLVSEIVISHS